MRGKCLREAAEQKRLVEAQKKKAKEAQKTKPPKETVIPPQGQTTDTIPQGQTDAIAQALNALDPDGDPGDIGVTTVDNFEEALKLAQETFDTQTEKGEAINEAYARIVDSALR